MPKAEALQEAKRWLKTLLADEAKKHLGTDNGSGAAYPFQNPRFWAAFILLGDPA